MKRVVALIWFCHVLPAVAETPTIVQPKPGAIVSSPVTIIVNQGASGSSDAGTSDMAGMPGMASMAPGHHGSHLHIIIDAAMPPPGSAITMDAHHLHLLRGETSRTVVLAPGPHRIQLVVGSVSHRAGGAPSQSAPVTFTVR